MIKIWSGTAWQARPIKWRNGAYWATSRAKVYNGSQWVMAQGMKRSEQIYASNDTFISPGDASNSHDYLTYMAAGANATGDCRRALIDLNLTFLPTVAHVYTAKLMLYQYVSTGTGNNSENFEVRRITAPWDSQTVTWDTRPDYDLTATTPELLDVNLEGWITLDCLSVVNQYLSGLPYYGMYVRPSSTTNLDNRIYFRTMENGYTPYLDITYTY